MYESLNHVFGKNWTLILKPLIKNCQCPLSLGHVKTIFAEESKLWKYSPEIIKISDEFSGKYV